MSTRTTARATDDLRLGRGSPAPTLAARGSTTSLRAQTRTCTMPATSTMLLAMVRSTDPPTATTAPCNLWRASSGEGPTGSFLPTFDHRACVHRRCAFHTQLTYHRSRSLSTVLAGLPDEFNRHMGGRWPWEGESASLSFFSLEHRALTQRTLADGETLPSRMSWSTVSPGSSMAGSTPDLRGLNRPVRSLLSFSPVTCRHTDALDCAGYD